MIVVSDASPIIGLAAVGHISLLEDLYGALLVPEAVLQEITAAQESAPGVSEVTAAEWIQAKEVQNRTLARALGLKLDRGEAEAIALAVEARASLVLMDERRGRAVAKRMGLSVVGVLGLLTEAKDRGYISAVRPVLESLDVKAGFRISKALYEHVLHTVGEETR